MRIIKFVNLTPHAIIIDNFNIPRSGNICRIRETETSQGHVQGIPVVFKEMGDIENLPNDEFGDLVDTTLETMASGSVRGCIAMPTASPIGRKLPANTLRNYETLVQKTSDFSLV